MKILVLGGGLMGPAAAWWLLRRNEVEQVMLVDRDRRALGKGRRKLAPCGDSKLATSAVDLRDVTATTELVRQFDAVVSALPPALIPAAIRAALGAGTPLVDLNWPPDEELRPLRRLAKKTGGLALLGCGVDPGLTEILGRYAASQLEHVEELHGYCGGLPRKPAPPLGYKIVFGGRQLPLREEEALRLEEGRLRRVPRYSEVEEVHFDGFGELEAYDEGFPPWLLELPELQGLRRGSQKTLRWPGYAVRAGLLRELGLLSQRPLKVEGQTVVPKQLLDALLRPRVKLRPKERDLTLFRVVARGTRNASPAELCIEMVDRYDAKSGWTSMARVTAFTAASIALMAADGTLAGAGLLPPERLVTGVALKRLLSELEAEGIRFCLTWKQTGSLMVEETGPQPKMQPCRPRQRKVARQTPKQTRSHEEHEDNLGSQFPTEIQSSQRKA